MTLLTTFVVALISIGPFADGSTSHATPAATDGVSTCHKSLLEIAAFEPVEKMRDSLPALAASVKIEFEGGDKCSGAFVSDEGDILTASHCLGSCKGNTCDVVINGVKTTATIKFESPCRPFEINRQNRRRNWPGKSPKPGELNCLGKTDIAILTPATLPKQYSCLSIGKNAPIGDAVYTIGYPAQTTRGEKDSNGKDVYASYGKVIPKNESCLMKSSPSLLNWLLGYRRGKLIDMGAKYVGPEGIDSTGRIQTTVDLNHGSSGGPLINSSGEVVAVASAAAHGHSENIECEGSGFFAPILGAEATGFFHDTNFHIDDLKCQKKKVLPTKLST